MPTRFVDVQTIDGTRRTVNADAVTRVVPLADGTSIIEFVAPQSAIAVKDTAEHVRSTLAPAETAGIVLPRKEEMPTREPPALPSDALGG